MFDLVNDIPNIKSVFATIGKTELEYRGLENLSHDSILDDIYETSLCLSLRGQDGKGSCGAQCGGQEFTAIETIPSAHRLSPRSKRSRFLQ